MNPQQKVIAIETSLAGIYSPGEFQSQYVLTHRPLCGLRLIVMSSFGRGGEPLRFLRRKPCVASCFCFAAGGSLSNFSLAFTAFSIWDCCIFDWFFFCLRETAVCQASSVHPRRSEQVVSPESFQRVASTDAGSSFFACRNGTLLTPVSAVSDPSAREGPG